MTGLLDVKATPKSPELAQMAKEVKALQDRSLQLFIARNNHHESKFLKRGVIGTVIRLEDKLTDVEKGGKDDEDLVECFLDIVNYAIMGAVICQRALDKGMLPKDLSTKIRLEFNNE